MTREELELLIDIRDFTTLLLVFSVTPFKIDQNKYQNRARDKVKNLRKEGK